MKLPASLQAWQDWLNWFQPEQAQSIGATLLRLNSLLGDNWGRLQSGSQEPNGIDDLRQRGPYHRLLLSEWSLADELPDEFLRRAANGEHLFLSPRLETKKSDERIIALFDSGPDQIGSARLVHIALWILMARRARQLGIDFSWGVLHSPGILHAADTPRFLAVGIAEQRPRLGEAQRRTRNVDRMHDPLERDEEPLIAAARRLLGDGIVLRIEPALDILLYDGCIERRPVREFYTAPQRESPIGQIRVSFPACC